jgi:hypothetical protein
MRTRRVRPDPVARSAFAGCCFPPDGIVLAVRWYLRVGLSYRDAGNTGTDNQHTHGGYVGPAFPARAPGRMFRFRQNRFSGSYVSLASTRRSKLAP